MLDSGVLGRLCAPEPDLAVETWALGLMQRGRLVMVPEICDYEIRREMIRIRSVGLARLDELATIFEYLPLTTPAMREAAQLWARLRAEGRPTASDHSMDADCVLAGQALVASRLEGRPVVVATTNVGHLSRMTEARAWREVV
jgi:predicted nucleic acid-binding protein